MVSQRRRDHPKVHDGVSDSAWTFETMDLHLDLSVERVRELLEQYRIAHAEVHAIQDKAVADTATALGRRLEDMNNWRDQLREQEGTFTTKAEFNAHINGQAQRLQDQITSLQQDTIRLTAEVTGTTNVANQATIRGQQLEDRFAQGLPREVYEQQHNALQNRVEIIEKWRATLAGRTAVLIGVVGLSTGLLGVVFGHIFFK